MRAIKIVAILILVYVAIVVGFETLIGTLQPSNESTITITTFDADGTGHERVVSRLDADGKLYIAANHWPRAWRSLLCRGTCSEQKASRRRAPHWERH